MWIEAGLKEIGRAGVEGVRVEVLAGRLGITKGGFYRRFKDRRPVLDALFETWTRGRAAAVEAQTQLSGDEDARARLKSVIKLYSERLNPQGMAIELAIRQWARTDKAAAREAVASVDAARLQERRRALPPARPSSTRTRRRAPSCSTPSFLGKACWCSISHRASAPV